MRRRQKTDETQQAEGEDYTVFVGVARVEQGMLAPSIEAALNDAYEKAKAATGKTRYRVVDIIVSGSNPIDECKVVLTPTP